MGVDSSYGSGAPLSAAASAARRRTAASSRLRANSAALRKRAITRQAANYGTPIAKVGRFFSDPRVAETTGLIALGILGAVAGTNFSRGRSSVRIPRSGARPMTTAQRSAAVTRAGRNGVGYIGPSIKPRDAYFNQEHGDYPGIASEPFSSYDSAYHRASEIYRRKYGKPAPNNLQVIHGRPPKRYEGYTEELVIEDYLDPNGDSGVAYDAISGAMQKTLDWRALQGPLRKTASIKKRGR